MDKSRKKIVILSGAGISAESGISTFRDADGLWEGHDVMEVASPEGWQANPQLVLDFYNQRRSQLKSVEPNDAHKAIHKLEQHFEVQIVTQNVDDLHERAGSKNVLHLHGQLRQVRSTLNENYVKAWEEDLNWGDLCPNGGQLRPHIVWFGEAVPMIEPALQHCQSADIIIIVGTSMQVYPAAGLIAYAPEACQIYYIDPKPNINYELAQLQVAIIPEPASIGMPQLAQTLIQTLEQNQ